MFYASDRRATRRVWCLRRYRWETRLKRKSTTVAHFQINCIHFVLLLLETSTLSGSEYKHSVSLQMMQKLSIEALIYLVKDIALEIHPK